MNSNFDKRCSSAKILPFLIYYISIVIMIQIPNLPNTKESIMFKSGLTETYSIGMVPLFLSAGTRGMKSLSPGNFVSRNLTVSLKK